MSLNERDMRWFHRLLLEIMTELYLILYNQYVNTQPEYKHKEIINDSIFKH